MSFSPITNIIIISSSFSCYDYVSNSNYATTIDYKEYSAPQERLPSTLEYNVQTMNDIINYQNQKILDLLFQQEYKYHIQK